MSKNRARAAVKLPTGVHRVRSRGIDYWYYQPHRGTPAQGERLRLPRDPHSPEFWHALRQAQGTAQAGGQGTVNAAIDAYLTSNDYAVLAKGTQGNYRRFLGIARRAWGELAIEGLRPVHVQTVIDQMAERPSNANNFLVAMRVLSGWARKRDFVGHSLVEGVEGYRLTGGHKPWSQEQITAAHERLKGALRRAVFLGLYTGQRGSDIVRMAWTDVDGDFIRVRQQKTGRELWCPVLPVLREEMASWERQPGPIVRKPNGRAYSRKLLTAQFQAAREEVPELAGATLHGLRSTAVVNLRRAGLSIPQISDAIGMSMGMIERYARFADKRANAEAVLHAFENAARTKIVKH